MKAPGESSCTVSGEGGGGDHIKETGMLIVSFRDRQFNDLGFSGVAEKLESPPINLTLTLRMSSTDSSALGLHLRKYS